MAWLSLLLLYHLLSRAGSASGHKPLDNVHLDKLNSSLGEQQVAPAPVQTRRCIHWLRPEIPNSCLRQRQRLQRAPASSTRPNGGAGDVQPVRGDSVCGRPLSQAPARAAAPAVKRTLPAEPPRFRDSAKTCGWTLPWWLARGVALTPCGVQPLDTAAGSPPPTPPPPRFLYWSRRPLVWSIPSAGPGRLPAPCSLPARCPSTGS